MLFFGHIGLTAGVVKVCQELTAAGLETKSGEVSGKINRIRDGMRSIDYRFVLVGSLLPDIIDKPMWMFTGSNIQWSGRGYAHTFLFSLVLLAAGLILVTRRNKTWLLTVSLCSFIHLVFDEMWLNPVTLWWPLLGPIQRGETAGWLSSMWQGLVSSPYVFVSEAVGLAIALYIGLRLLIGRRVVRFLKKGDINWGELPDSRR